jgi:AraC family transcriptional regulator
MGLPDPINWAKQRPKVRSTDVRAGELSPLPKCQNSFLGGSDLAELTVEAARALDDIRRAIERSPGSAHEAAVRLVALLSQSPTAPTGVRGGLAPWQQRKVDRYLRAHLEQPLRLDELAKQIPLSVSHFCRAFKETFGSTPHAYLVQVRLEMAQHLMLTSRESLSQIALASGLADQAHLTKLFRRVIGETPSAWRRRNLTDQQAEARHRQSKECETTGSFGVTDHSM